MDLAVFMTDPLGAVVIISGIINIFFSGYWLYRLNSEQKRIPEEHKKIMAARMKIINRHLCVLGAIIFVQVSIIIMVFLYIMSGVVFAIPLNLRFVAFGVFMIFILFLVNSGQCTVATVRKLMQVRIGDK